MLTPRNTSRRVITTRRRSGNALGGLLALLVVVTMVAHDRTFADDDLPDVADTVGAFLTLRQWVDAFDAPDSEEPAARVPIGNATAVSVLLRRGGRVVGSGADWTGDDLMLRRATGRALASVLGDPGVRALPEDLVDSLGRTLTIELELTGPLRPALGRTFEQIGVRFEPGIDGLALRRGDDYAFGFSSVLQARNGLGTPEGTLAALAADLELPRKDLPELVAIDRVSVYTFASTRLAQSTPTAPPTEPYRGDVIVSGRAVDRDGLVRLADGIIDHLARSTWPLSVPGAPDAERGRALGLRGAYRPIADEYRPMVAPALDQAVTSFVLLRHAASPAATDPARARAFGLRLLTELAIVEAGEDDPRQSLGACAAIVLAACEIADDRAMAREVDMLIDDAVARLLGVTDPGAGMTCCAPDANGDMRPIPPVTRAMIVAALAQMRLRDADVLPAIVLARAIDAAWKGPAEHQRVALMPWIVMAEIDLAASANEPRLRRVADLESMREMLFTVQHGFMPDPSPLDVRGGFGLVGGTRAGASAQSAPAAAGLAIMLADERLTSDSARAIAMTRQRAWLRFAAQLAVRGESTWSYRNPSRALGGIRTAPWNSDQEILAQAMGLLAISESIRALDAVVPAAAAP